MATNVVIQPIVPGGTQTVTYTRRSAVQAGDLELIFLWSNWSGTPTPPSGWTYIGGLAVTNTATLAAMWHYVTAADVAPGAPSVSFTMPSEFPGFAYGTAYGVVLVYRGVVATNPIDTFAVPSGFGLVAPGLTTATLSELVFCAYLAGTTISAGGITLPGSLSALADYYGTSGGQELGDTFVGVLTSGAPGSVASQTATDPGSYGYASQTLAMTVALIQQAPPLVPTLNDPAPSAYLDVVDNGGPFACTYNPAIPSNVLTGYQFRFKGPGASSYSYWNASTNTTSSTPVTNAYSGSGAGSQVFVTFPTGGSSPFTQNAATSWSMASVDAGGVGPFAADEVFNSAPAPVTTMTGPTGTVTTQQPIALWSSTFPTGNSQTAYQLLVYTASTASLPGFMAGITTPLWASGIVSGSANAAQIGASLAPGVAYVAYVQVFETGAEPGNWASSSFSVVLDVPATPTLLASVGVDSAGAPIVDLTVVGFDNMLTSDGASSEGTLAGIVPTNATLAKDSSWAADGSYSVKMTATASGNMTIAVQGARASLVTLSTWNTAASTSQANVNAPDGTPAIRVTVTAAGADTYLYQTVSCAPSTTYILQGDAWVATLTAAALDNRSLRMSDGTVSAELDDLPSTAPTGAFYEHALAITTSSAATGLFLAVYGPEGTTYWEDLAVIEVVALAVAPGQTYSGWAVGHAAVTPRSVQVGLAFFSSGGSQIGSTTFGSTVTDTTGSGATAIATVSVVAPAGAATVELVYEVIGCAANEVHNCDNRGIFPGTVPAAWSRGGFIGNELAYITYTDADNPMPVPVRDGIALPMSLAQQASAVDREAIPTVTRTYSAVLASTAP